MGLERNQIRAARGLVEELRAARDAIGKAVQHSRVLASSDRSFEWMRDSLEVKKDEMDGLGSGIRDALEYVAKMDLGDGT